MKISVITVSYNSAKTIGRTLESFCQQSHRDRELILVDGGSRDDTVAIARSFVDEGVSVRSEADHGIYDAMNKGLARFSGDAVGFLSSNDRFKDSETLSAIAGGLEQAEIVYGNLDFVSAEDSATIVRRWRSASFQKGAFKNGWMPAHPTFYVRRSVVKIVGQFNISYSIAADYDYMLRAMELYDFRTVFVDRILVEMTYGGVSTGGVKAYLKSNFEALNSRRIWLKTGLVDRALITKPLGKVGQYLAQ